MKRLIPAFAAILGCSSGCWAAPPTPLTTLHAVATLNNQQANEHLPVAFQATVTYFFRAGADIDVQDGNVAIFVRNTQPINILPGDRVLVKGTIQPSFRPYVLSNSITVLHHGSLPNSVPATFDDLLGTRLNCRLVRVSGVVRTAYLATRPRIPGGHLELLTDGGYIDVEIQTDDLAALRNLIDAEVEITGSASRKFDGKMQQTGAKVKVSSLAGIRILNKSKTSPWSLPLTPLGKIITGYHVHDAKQRLRVHGTITYYEPGSTVVLQDGSTSLWVLVGTSEPLRIGDVADATGFANLHDGHLRLERAEIRDTGVQAPVVPLPATWHDLASWGKNRPGGHENDLVSIDGRVVAVAREAAQDEYVLLADGREFTAIYRHPPLPAKPPPMPRIPIGATVSVAGICLITDSNPVDEEVPFDILMRSSDDIQMVSKPPLLSVPNLVVVVGLLLLIVMLVGIRGWILERRMRRQTATLAYMERRRSRILEDISGSRPLAEIIEQITEMVSFRLHGAPCWCQIAGGARLGNYPPTLHSLRLIELDIPGRSGAALGVISAAFDDLTKPAAEEREAISMGAGLASLAIETRRLYSDLTHRSEFDLLTDVQNRFSLEKHLDALIDEARRTAGIFGLIYIDLDGFKKINDHYGHQLGDLYLQEATSRMKRQLRPTDTLARLGGDEFGVLVSIVHNRSDVEEIALRMEHCFDEPFAIENHSLQASASVGIALYPNDATTRDSLLNAADAAMYVVKNSKKTTA
ncbi:MAG: GGDEF domain-containing protein [Terracidiphilus sp.]|nr:GGDEF domain-containing protein [Terracidiphilus sp.]